MLGINFSGWLMLGIGFLAGLLIGNKDFRVKFFKGLRGFLGQVNKGAQDQGTKTNKDLRRMHDGIQHYGKNVVGSKRKPSVDDDVDDDPSAEY